MISVPQTQDSKCRCLFAYPEDGVRIKQSQPCGKPVSFHFNSKTGQKVYHQMCADCREAGRKWWYHPNQDEMRKTKMDRTAEAAKRKTLVLGLYQEGTEAMLEVIRNSTEGPAVPDQQAWAVEKVFNLNDKMAWHIKNRLEPAWKKTRTGTRMFKVESGKAESVDRRAAIAFRDVLNTSGGETFKVVAL